MSAPDKLTHEVLLELQSGKNQEANFRLLFQRYYPRVRGYFLKKRFSPEDADELTQDVFVSIFKSIGTLRTPALFEGWLFTVALNALRGHLEKTGAAKRGGAEAIRMRETVAVDPELVAESGDQPLAALLQAESIEKIEAVMNDLPEQMRRCLRLRVVEELSYQEVSLAMGIAINTVKAHLFQARKLLMERLS